MQGYLRNITSSLSTAAKTFQDRYTQGRQYRFSNVTVEEIALIAEGGFGFIYLCKDLETDTKYVVKKLNCQDKERLSLALREVEVYERIGTSKHIVKYFGHIVEQIDYRAKEVNLLFEYLPKGHLLDLLNRSNGVLTEPAILGILLDVAQGLTHLHKVNIQNRDIKIENILQAADGRWVLVDLGSWSDQSVNPKAVNRADLGRVEEQIGRFTTMMYRSPEMVDLYKGFVIDTKSDIWMLGCVLFTLMHNKHPFQDESPLAIANARFHLDSSVFSRFNQGLIDLLFWLLAENPTDRPTASQLVRILSDWQSHKAALPLPDAVLERAQRMFKIHGVSRSAERPPPVPPSAQVPETHEMSAQDNWADFDNFFQGLPSAPSDPVAAAENWANFEQADLPTWTADFDAFLSDTAGSSGRKTDDLVDLLG